MDLTVKRVAVVATGVIGASWAAYFLARGLDVDAWDPSPGAQERLRTAVAAHWEALSRQELADGARLDRLRWHDRLEDALARRAQSGESLRDLSPSLERCVAPAPWAMSHLFTTITSARPFSITRPARRAS